MELKEIFTDTRTREAAYPQEDFIRVTVYAVNRYMPPYLFEVEHGWKDTENKDWSRDWYVVSQYRDNAKAIRQAVRWIDEYVFQDNVAV